MDNKFTVFPAIDLHEGRVVRLQQGDLQRQTVYDHDPLSVARSWVQAGAEWIHVVNLDGAFRQRGARNLLCLPALSALGARIQFGGGLRTMDDVAAVFDSGISRIVLGTVAVQEPEFAFETIARFGPDRVIIGIDVFQGHVRTHGWQRSATLTPIQLALQMKAGGAQSIVHTDISRDGLLTGANVDDSGELATDSGLQVIVSGGVTSLDDIKRAWQARRMGIGGIIIGRALYEGTVDLGEALATTHAG